MNAVLRILLVLIPISFLARQALNPFYVFQIYSVCLWIFGYNYIYFSLAIVLMSLISITLTVYSTRKVGGHPRRLPWTFGKNFGELLPSRWFRFPNWGLLDEIFGSAYAQLAGAMHYNIVLYRLVNLARG